MNKYIESLFIGICEKLQLSTTLYDQAVKRYNIIANIINEDEIFEKNNLSIYPQGSFRLKTTVKPLINDEYDLDFVAELPINSVMSPQDLYDHIVRILSNDGIHNDMIEKKNRCVRVNYANDFHIDIMPGKLVNADTHEIIVPDRKLSEWGHKSNPIGFADWFEKQAKTHIEFELNRMIRDQCYIEKVTEQEIAKHLEPLRRAVQLVKRYRDIYCDVNNAEPVRSIVICTLMGQITKFTGDTLQVIETFCQYVNGLIVNANGKPFTVKNPVVNEVLTEKWDEGNNYQDFVSMIQSLTKDIKLLRSYSYNTDINKITKKMFGETVTNAVLMEFAKEMNHARQDSTLFVTSTGVLSLSNSEIPVKKNTFYGEENKVNE